MTTPTHTTDTSVAVAREAIKGLHTNGNGVAADCVAEAIDALTAERDELKRRLEQRAGTPWSFGGDPRTCFECGDVARDECVICRAERRSGGE